MSRQLQDIFEECVERLRQGDSIENCLNSYPEVASELQVLLRASLNVNWRASMVQPRPEFKARARAQFIRAQQHAAQAKEVKPKLTIFSLQRAWVPALAVVLILVFSSVGTAAAASKAMPDEPLYPAKIATEQVQLTFAFSNEAKAELNVKLAEIRSQEIATMASQGKTEQVIATTERLTQNLDAAETAIYKIEEAQTGQVLSTTQETDPTPELPAAEVTEPSTEEEPEKSRDTTTQEETQFSPSQEEEFPVSKAEQMKQALNKGISKNLETMEKVKDKTPDQAKEALQKAIDMAKNKQNKLNKPSGKTESNIPGNSGNNPHSANSAKKGND